MSKAKFELAFWGGLTNKRFPRYKRNHVTIEEARAEAYRVLGRLGNRGAHPAIIYDVNDNQVAAIA